MLIYLAKAGEVKFVNGSGWAPKSASIAELAARGGQREDGSIAPLVSHATSALLLAAQKYGRLNRAQILAPSVELAERGFVVSENLQNVFKRNQPRLAPFPSTTRVWFRNGDPVKMGDVVAQPELGRTFRAIAADGSDAFYRGPIARRIVEYLRANGGSMLDASDFADFNAEEAEPLHIRYKSYHICGCPPNSHGHVMLPALNLLEGVDLKAMGHNSPLYPHYVTEALSSPSPTATLMSATLASSRIFPCARCSLRNTRTHRRGVLQIHRFPRPDALSNVACQAGAKQISSASSTNTAVPNNRRRGS